MAPKTTKDKIQGWITLGVLLAACYGLLTVMNQPTKMRTYSYPVSPRLPGPETWEEHVYKVYSEAADRLDKDAKSPKWRGR